MATSTNPVGDIFCCGTRHLHAHAREAIYAACLICTAGAMLFTCAQPLLLPSPFEGLARWLKSRSMLRSTKGAHPNSHLLLIRVHRAVIETQKAAQNRLKKRLATTATHHAVGSRHRDDVVRWNEAFCSLFSSVFFKVQQTVHKTTFYSGPPSVLNSPGCGALNLLQKFPPRGDSAEIASRLNVNF